MTRLAKNDDRKFNSNFFVITADIFTRLPDLNFNQSKLSKLSFLASSLLCLNFKKASFHSLLLASLLKFVNWSKIAFLIFLCPKFFISIIKSRLLSPKTHIINCFCHILANWNNFYFAEI